MAGNIQSIPDQEVLKFDQWLLTRYEKLPGTTKVTASSIPQPELIRFGKDVLQQVTQQFGHYMTPTGSMGANPSQRSMQP